MHLCFLLLIAAFVALHAAHANALALVCLAMALFMLHPVRVLVLLCLGGAMSAVVAVVNALLPGRYSRESGELDVPREPPPARSVTRQSSWYGQASPFLDYRGRHVDEHKPPV